MASYDIQKVNIQIKPAGDGGIDEFTVTGWGSGDIIEEPEAIYGNKRSITQGVGGSVSWKENQRDARRFTLNLKQMHDDTSKFSDLFNSNTTFKMVCNADFEEKKQLWSLDYCKVVNHIEPVYPVAEGNDTVDQQVIIEGANYEVSYTGGIK